VLKENKQSFIQNSQEKLTLFLKLNRKYLKKLKSITLLLTQAGLNKFESLSQNKEEILNELGSTIDKFDQTIHSPKLVEYLFEVTNRTNSNLKKFFDEYDIDETDSGLTKIVLKLEDKVKKLTDENTNLINKKANIDELNDKSEEISKLKRKLNDERLGKEELEMSLKYVKQINKDLETKMSIMDDESLALKKNVKSANEKLKELELAKNKKTNLENELKFKDSIINYLETMLKSNNISYSNKFYEIGKEKAKNSHKDNSDEEGEFEFTNKHEYSGNNYKSPIKDNQTNDDKDSKFNFSGRKFNTLKDSLNSIASNNNRFNIDPNQSDNEYRFKPSYTYNTTPQYEKEFNLFGTSTSKSSNIKNEIDNLDSEIKHLQNKLKVMIDVSKKK
jgi:hypothetical protein